MLSSTLRLRFLFAGTESSPEVSSNRDCCPNILKDEEQVQRRFPEQNKSTEQTPLLQKQTTKAKRNLDELREREAAMHKLENDIVDLNEMFKDLVLLYNSNEDIIDSIEADVDPAVSHVEAANVNWDKARYYQKKARRRKCILILIPLIIVVLLGLIIYFSIG
ncbi:syntaxin-12-like [Clytia hemisphaerica]|uniref:t-SNARE coiled-coil homology domain-containing protein n=1 Tax=Clytia hemisphaerica TaxID=252671 RepID=A0A7M5XMM4_9CNID